MTKAEFDTFLAPLGLIWKHKNAPVTDSRGFSFGAGWYQITADLITDLIALDWDKHIAQAKEKFGGGRFYIGAGSDAIFLRIREWENQTYETCMECGTNDQVSTSGGWAITLCNNCRSVEKNTTPSNPESC